MSVWLPKYNPVCKHLYINKTTLDPYVMSQMQNKFMIQFSLEHFH